MKILLVHNYYKHKGGEDIVFEAESSLLIRYGHTVEALTFNNKAIITPWEIIKAGVGTIYNTRSAALIKTKILDFQPDIIHIHNFFPLISPAVFYIASSLSVPIVMTLHNFRLVCPGGVLVRDNQTCELCVNKIFPIDGIIYGCFHNSRINTTPIALMSCVHKMIGTWKNKVDRYIALSDFSRDKIIQSSLGISKDKISVKPNFTDDKGFMVKGKQDYAVYVGRFSYEKGVKTVLQAFENSTYKLKVIGAGPLENVVLRYAERCHNIEYLGFQDKSAVLEILKQAKVLVFPSICYENFPLAIVEALSVATPVITSNIGGQAEVIQDGINGLHFLVNDSEDLKNKLKTIWENEQQYKNLTHNARATYAAYYTPEKNHQDLISIYKSIIDHKKAYLVSSE